MRKINVDISWYCGFLELIYFNETFITREPARTSSAFDI